jgi:hypothetical protein
LKGHHVKANEGSPALFAGYHAKKPVSIEPAMAGCENERSRGIAADLAGVPETMLWILHNRACGVGRLIMPLLVLGIGIGMIAMSVARSS